LSFCRTWKNCLYIKMAKLNSEKQKKSSFYEEKKFGRIDSFPREIFAIKVETKVHSDFRCLKNQISIWVVHKWRHGLSILWQHIKGLSNEECNQGVRWSKIAWRHYKHQPLDSKPPFISRVEKPKLMLNLLITFLGMSKFVNTQV
jgi:hypothetical protein